MPLLKGLLAETHLPISGCLWKLNVRFAALGGVALLGDLNARTGMLQEELKDDTIPLHCSQGLSC